MTAQAIFGVSPGGTSPHIAHGDNAMFPCGAVGVHSIRQGFKPHRGDTTTGRNMELMPLLMYRPSGALSNGVLGPAHGFTMVCPGIAVGKRVLPLRGFCIRHHEPLRDVRTVFKSGHGVDHGWPSPGWGEVRTFQ